MPIMTTLGYVVRGSGAGREVLLVHRIARSDDEQLGKYNGLGGKMEPDEDPVACMRREVMEEAGLEIMSMRLRGTVSWPGFGKNGEDVFGFIFLIDGFHGEPPTHNVEGALSWHPVATMLDLPMWEGDRYFVPAIFNDDPRQFHLVIPYSNGHPTGCSTSYC